MNVDQVFSGNYLKAVDLQNREATVTIARVMMETIGTDQRVVAYFQGKEKGLVVNKTNANNIKEALGSAETNNWIGQRITLFQAYVDYQGKTVPAIRVRPATNGAPAVQPPVARPVPAQTPAPASPDFDDDIPF